MMWNTMLGVVVATLSLAGFAGARTAEVSNGGLSLREAVARIREARASGDAEPWQVRIRGELRLTETVLLTEADHDIAFIGDKGAVISGGQTVVGWKDIGGGVWEADAPREPDGKPMFFDQLWANGRRAPCSRLPREGWMLMTSGSQVVSRVENGMTNYLDRAAFTNECLKALASLPPEDMPYIEAGVVISWGYGLQALKSYDPERNEIASEVNFPWRSWNKWCRGTRVALFNVRFAFDESGEWFLDMKAGKVRYRPLPGETLESFSCIVPRRNLTKLVELRGDWRRKRFVSNVSFTGITFAHTSPPMPENAPQPIAMYQSARFMDGAITAEGVRGLSFENCRIAQTGNTAMRFNSACVSNRIVNCTLEDLGAGGVWMGADYEFKDKASEIPRQILPPVRADAVAFNLISNCTVRFAGAYHLEGPGIALTHCSDSKVIHCDIHDISYSGISVGWTWGFSGSVAQRNEIAFNHIWNLGGGVMSDLGGVYTLGTSFGTTVHDNVIHDLYPYDLGYGGFGLYCDEGSEGVVMERNLVWNTNDSGFIMHYGTGCIIRNNILALNRMVGAVCMRRNPVKGIPCDCHFVNNIVYTRGTPMCCKKVLTVGGVWANNLWWDSTGKGVFEETLDWDGWKASGKETGSRFADPLFVDVDRRDFRLKPDSPAFALGFKPWDFSRAGRRTD